MMIYSDCQLGLLAQVMRKENDLSGSWGIPSFLARASKNRVLFTLPNDRLCQPQATCSDSHDLDKTLANHSERRCSRPRPVTRLQATGQPKYLERGRRVMRGGSKAHAWLRRNKGQTRFVLCCTGKAIAFTKGTKSY